MSNLASAHKPKRIVWMGESVARGYFYEPLYGPAMALESALRAADPGAAFEIVNLSKSGLRFQPLLQMMREAKQLQPDAVVFLAGNNWRYNLDVDNGEKAKRVRLQGPSEVFALEASALAERSQTFVRHAVAQLAEADITVVVIIPEFNLVDFGPPLNVTPPWLPNGGAARWTQLRNQAATEFAQADYQAAASSAAELRLVEEDATGLGAHVLGRSLLALGKVVAARKALEVARDRLDCPRLGSAGENALRIACTDAGIAIVDLPREFELLTGSVPDRTLFHDYCHMTGRAIAFTACRTAEILAPTLFGSPPQPLIAAHFEPAPEVEAQAHLLAAYYTMTFGQPDEFVAHHLSHAARFPRLRTAISLLADGYLRREIPLVLSRSWARLLEGACPELAEFTKHPPTERRRRLDTPIYHTAIKLCTEQRDDIAALAGLEHGLDTANPMDLLSESYLRRSAPVAWKGRVLKSLSARTEFVFLARRSAPVEVNIAWRMSHNVRPGNAYLSVNGAQVMSTPLTSSWVRSTMAIPGALVQLGLNVLAVDWPAEVTGIPDDLGEDLARTYESQGGDTGELTWNEAPDLCKLPTSWRPSFGHIDVLTISTLAA